MPTSDALPPLQFWTPSDAALRWSYKGEKEGIHVRAFGRRLECGGGGKNAPGKGGPSGGDGDGQDGGGKGAKGGFLNRVLDAVGLGEGAPRAPPTGGDPSTLLGVKVATEDDILHVRHLPDFGGALSARDCELMLQYLTAPYLRIPLLLRFFSDQVRLEP